MAERRYGFRFSFAEGCILVVSIMGASFLVFLFGVYTGRELEARKAAARINTVRFTALAEGEASSSGKEGRGKTTSTVSASPLSDKPTTVVIMPSPRPSDAPATAPVSGSASSTAPQEKASATGPETGQSPQATGTNGQPAKTTSFASPAFPSGSHSALSEKNPTAPQGKEASANLDSAQKTRTDLASLKATSTLSATPHVSEEKKQIMQMMQAGKKEQAPLPAPQRSSAQGRWSIQVQALRDEGGAQQLAKALQSQGYTPTISRVVRDGEVWYRVRVGSFPSSDEARASIEQLRRTGKFSQAYPVSN